MVHMTRSTMLGKLAALQQTSAQEVDAARESIKWPPHLPPRHQTSSRHQVPTKSTTPQEHQTQSATRDPTHPPTKLTALGLMRVKPGVVHGFRIVADF